MALLTLTGKGLGERHLCLNTAVIETYENIDFNNFEQLPEKSPVDRILKINVAAKLRNIDFIIQNLKDDDTLFVSKALKCKWLLEYEYGQIVNPQNLEEKLYPTMITTAVTKMKKLIYLNLKDVGRCESFFLYYADKDFQYAIHFLKNCSPEFIYEQGSKYIVKISPPDLKILSEKNPQIIKTFYDALEKNEELKAQYLAKEKCYFNILKFLLKSNTDMVLDIVEMYFNENKFKRFSPKATKLVMKHYKDRFLQKSELYSSILLDLKTLANCLNTEEAMDLVLKLARDKYLNSQNWFTYKKVEPLIKRIKPQDRAAFKKRVFVDKDIGEEVKEWSYKMPSPPILLVKPEPIFKDLEHNPREYQNLGQMDFRSMLKKRKYAKWNNSASKTMLDTLFDEYRVASFDKTLFELRKKLRAESSSQKRQYMMLVLVSKSGGREDKIFALMELLVNYMNEPSQIRAAVVRSLVKRAHVWRVPDDTWNLLLEFAHGLGLDANPPEADCVEGVHAVVIRQMLLERKCDSEIFAVYLKHFSTLTEYSLAVSEKNVISKLLPNMLFSYACIESEVSSAVSVINKLLDTLHAFRIPIEKYPGLIDKIERLAETDICNTSSVLRRLYKSKVARRKLFKVNFEIMKSEESYLNALRHNSGVICPHELIKHILCVNLPYQKFFRKIAIYFNEKYGLAKKCLDVIRGKDLDKPLAKALALLLGDELELYIRKIDDNNVENKHKPFAAALRANIHLSRPALNLETFGWSAIGTKAVANKVLICRYIEVDDHIKKLLQSTQTIKLALTLAKRKGDFIDVFTILSNIKPTVAIKTGLNILRKDKNRNVDVWTIIKPLIKKIDITTASKKYWKLSDVDSISTEVRASYITIIYGTKMKTSFYQSMPFLCHIENFLQTVDDDFIENVLREFLNYFVPTKVFEDFFTDYVKCVCLHLRICVKYLLLCENEEQQKKKFESIGVMLFDKMDDWWVSENKAIFRKYYLDEIITAFKYYETFLNEKYVSCMVILEKAFSWVEKHLPIEKYFKVYVHMQLTMLYFTAIRSSIQKLPEHSLNDDNQLEARRMIGKTFGKYLAQIVDILKAKYFASITYLYKDIILCLQTHFLHSCQVFTESLILGILDQSKDADNYVLAIYLLKEKQYCLEKNARKEILQRIKENENIEVQMVLFAEKIF